MPAGGNLDAQRCAEMIGTVPLLKLALVDSVSASVVLCPVVVIAAYAEFFS
jgi:hypothetical protein